MSNNIPTKEELLIMFETLLDIIDWKMDPSTEWETEDECTTIGNMSDQAHILLKKLKENK